MAGTESGNAEVSKLVVVKGDRVSNLEPQNNDGIELLRLLIESLKTGLGDGRLSESPFSLSTKAPVLTTPRLTLARARKAYITEPNDPDRLADYMEYFWKARKRELGVPTSDLVVSTCPWDENQISQFRGQSIPDMGRFIPEVVAGDLELIKKGFPEIHFYLYGGLKSFSDIRNEYVLKGWGRSESDIDAPYTYTTEQQLKDKFDELGRLGLTVPAHALFGVFSHDFTKQFLDEVRTIIRTLGSTKSSLGSSLAGRVLDALFSPGGGLSVNSGWGPGDRDRGLGGRSFQVGSCLN